MCGCVREGGGREKFKLSSELLICGIGFDKVQLTSPIAAAEN